MMVIMGGVVEGRPAVWVAELTDAKAGVTNGYSAVGAAYNTQFHGKFSNHISMFFLAAINTTIIKASIYTNTGGLVCPLKWNNTQKPNDLQAVFGRCPMNTSTFSLFTQDLLYVRVDTAAYPNGAMAGYFYSRAFTFLSILNPGNVVGTTPPATDINVGLGLFTSYPNTNVFPLDIVQLDQTIAATTVTNGRIIHSIINATSGGIYGPATPSTTGPVYNALSPTGYNAYTIVNGSGAVNLITQLGEGFNYYSQITSGAFPGGELRGSLFPIVDGKRRELPTSVAVGVGSLRGNLASLFRITQFGQDNNPNSYVQFIPDPTSHQFSATFTFVMPVGVKNLLDIRLLTIDLNLFGDGSLWVFSYFNYTAGAYVPWGSFQAKNTWTNAYVDCQDYQVQNFVSSAGIAKIQWTTTSAVNPLFVDAFTIRPWTPSPVANQVIKYELKNLAIEFKF